MPEYVSEARSLFPEWHEIKRNSSDKSNLAGILGDHEDANVITPGIRGKHKKAEFLGFITFCSPDNLFSIRESHFDFPAVHGSVRTRGFMVLGLATEVPHKVNRLEVLHLNSYFLPLKWVFLGKKIERLLQWRKIVNVALNAVPL